MKIYLIYSESKYLIKEKIASITTTSNVITYDLMDSSLSDVLVEASYVSMFKDMKYIIVNNATFFGSKKLSDDEASLLEAYLKTPNPYTTIIFTTTEKIDMRKKITKLIKEKYNFVDIPKLKSYEIESRVVKYFKDYGYSIDNDSAKYIVSNCLNNIDLVMNELDKIMLYYNKPTKILYKDIQKIVASSLNNNNFAFLDAVVNKDIDESFRLYHDLKVLKVEPLMLIIMLARDYRLIYNTKKMMNNHQNNIEIARALSLADWQLDKYIKKTYLYNLKELESIILKLSNLDLEIKSGKIDKFMGLELFILDICKDA